MAVVFSCWYCGFVDVYAFLGCWVGVVVVWLVLFVCCFAVGLCWLSCFIVLVSGLVLWWLDGWR